MVRKPPAERLRGQWVPQSKKLDVGVRILGRIPHVGVKQRYSTERSMRLRGAPMRLQCGFGARGSHRGQEGSMGSVLHWMVVDPGAGRRVLPGLPSR
jgi:hypothetical protein